MPGTTSLTPRAIAEIAHELRSPLGGIEAMVEMLAASSLDAEQARMIGALKASVAHLRAIADGVLGGDVHRPAVAPSRPLGEVLAAFELVSAARARAAGLEFRLAVTDEAITSWRAVPHTTPGGERHYSTLARVTAAAPRCAADRPNRSRPTIQIDAPR